ncbi:A24 family peptidase [Selenomonas sp.]|uniref:prepilin peptidase n=1 Tax=Selenomonas sp. TaxID=2053611 RepID=UPI0025E3D1A2|nr:A24 family peptidase [Selenomonas sp.]MCI6283767.1 A24 family peptidase [Selenomonas sp.]
MAMKIIGIVCAIVLAVAGGIIGSRWVELRYRAEREVLSFPERVRAQEKRRGGILSGAYGLLFCWSILTSGLLLHQQGLEIVGTPAFASAGGGALQEALSLIFLLAFVFFLVLYTVTDFEQQVIFDRQLVPFAVLGLLSLPLLGRPFFDHLLAAVIGFAVFLALAVLTRGAIGGGDIKLVAALGLWLGSDQLLTVVVAGTILGGLAALVLLLTGRRKRGEMFAYGPYFTIVALVLALV